MTDVRAKRRLRALEAAGVLRYQWPPGTDGQDDVEETAARLWRAREETSWEALQLRLETSFAAICREAEYSGGSFSDYSGGRRGCFAGLFVICSRARRWGWEGFWQQSIGAALRSSERGC